MEGWLDEGRRVAGAAAAREDEGGVGRRKGLEELWGRAGEVAVGAMRGIPWGSDYTVEETARGVDEVRTGLKRRLRVGGDDEEEAEEEESGEEMDVDGKEEREEKTGSFDPAVAPLGVEQVLRFMNTGVAP